MSSLTYSQIRNVRTLGPPGTNLEAAARWWCQEHGVQADVILHPTLEDGVGEMAMDGSEVLVACIVYPELHTLVFQNIKRLEIVECFVVPTHRMVLASRDGEMPRTVATHPAPQGLIPDQVADRCLVNSNSAAAAACAGGSVEGCVTTIVAAEANGLRVVRDFGSLPMGFSVHAAKLQ
jgi:hypothetical protein